MVLLGNPKGIQSITKQVGETQSIHFQCDHQGAATVPLLRGSSDALIVWDAPRYKTDLPAAPASSCPSLSSCDSAEVNIPGKHFI